MESFTGSRILTETSQARINDPCNAFNIESNAHFFDKLAWGIEAQEQAGGEVRYLVFSLTLCCKSSSFNSGNIYSIRPVRDELPFTISLNDGGEIRFRQGREGQQIDPPDLFCNTRLAIARVMYSCGASGFIDDLYGDDEAIVTQPVYLGGPFVSDDIRRLHDRLPVS